MFSKVGEQQQMQRKKTLIGIGKPLPFSTGVQSKVVNLRTNEVQSNVECFKCNSLLRAVSYIHCAFS